MSSHKLPISSLTKEAEVAVLAVPKETLELICAKPAQYLVGDLAAQSLISLHLLDAFPQDKIVGEEDTTELRKNDGLRSKVVQLVNDGFGKGRSEAGSWAEGQTWSEEELWTIDPIDGTLGFLRKEQYAVCLALIVDGQVELGVLACPNLGTNSRPIETADYKRLSLPASIPSSSIRFLESVESSHSAHGIQARIGALLGVPENTSLRMDSQAKYGCLGRGEGGA
ncbi:hypothetical protein QFC19_007423 [Naganishia cerealis]|uniref:Uncharacterized protein n=1 Tax=Naganishia cerealis TaxID=610337 RepID=A0ACC2V9G3_9TREE|nr:hypothetical protein QFC19_007423 [Naganishia cerealis]